MKLLLFEGEIGNIRRCDVKVLYDVEVELIEQCFNYFSEHRCLFVAIPIDEVYYTTTVGYVVDKIEIHSIEENFANYFMTLPIDGYYKIIDAVLYALALAQRMENLSNEQ